MEQNERRDDDSRGNRRVAFENNDHSHPHSEQRDEQSTRQNGSESRPALTQRERHERWPIG